jgi:chromosome segregation ATPase
MTRSLAAALVAALLLFAGAVACGNDDPDPLTTPLPTPGDLTLEQYFPRLAAIFQDADRRSGELEARLDDELEEATTFEEELAALDRSLEGLIDVIQDSIERIQALSAPEEVLQQQATFLDAIETIAGLLEDLREQLAQAEDRADAEIAVAEFEEDAERHVQRADQTCLDLQTIAIENDINVDLRCEE